MCAVPRGQQRYGAFVSCSGQLVNALVELRRDGEHQREKKCADKSRGHDGPQCNHLAVAETQLHCARVWFLQANIASTICRRVATGYSC